MCWCGVCWCFSYTELINTVMLITGCFPFLKSYIFTEKRTLLKQNLIHSTAIIQREKNLSTNFIRVTAIASFVFFMVFSQCFKCILSQLSCKTLPCRVYTNISTRRKMYKLMYTRQSSVKTFLNANDWLFSRETYNFL